MRTMIEIEREFAIYEAAASENDRPVLQGVLFTKNGRALAADGFIGAIVPARTPELVADVVVPADFLRTAWKRSKENLVRFLVDTESKKVMTVDELISDFLIDGTFPDLMRLIPEIDAAYTARTIHINPLLGVRLMKAIGAYDSRSKRGFLKLRPTARNNPIVALGSREDALGLYMPIFAAVPSDEEISALIGRVKGEVRAHP